MAPNPLKSARALLRNRPTAKLIEDFILTGKLNDPNIFTVRGWIMDELERRDTDAFNAWLDQDTPTDTSLRAYFKTRRCEQ